MIISDGSLAWHKEPEGQEYLDHSFYLENDVHSFWSYMRRNHPVHTTCDAKGERLHSIFSFSECSEVIGNHELFSSEYGTILASYGLGDGAQNMTMTVSDPPRHGVYRRPAMRRMNAGAVKRNMAGITDECHRLADSVVETGEVDFAEAIRMLPILLLGPFLGVPRSLWEDLARLGDMSVAPADPVRGIPDKEEVAARTAHAGIVSIIMDLIEHRQNSGQADADDIIGGLMGTELDGLPLSNWQVAMNCYSLVMGAHATSPHIASHLTVQLAGKPEAWAGLRAEPDSVTALTEEGYRWTTPTNHLLRRARKDTRLGGVEISEGDWLCTWVGSANRDENVWQDPFVFRKDRTPARHISFGVGAHFCVGAHLARAGLQAFFGRLAERVTEHEIAGPVKHLRSNWINGIVNLPVRFDAR